MRDIDSKDEKPNDHGYETPSRSQNRREALDVLKLAHALASLSDAQLDNIPLNDDVREEAQRTRAISQQIARKRQTQFLAKLLRRLEDQELEAIRAILDGDRAQSNRDSAALHRVEVWRDRLISEGDEALGELLQQATQLDRQHVRQLARQARGEREHNKPPHAQRELFRVLREALADQPE